jgi:hypothetical protein
VSRAREYRTLRVPQWAYDELERLVDALNANGLGAVPPAAAAQGKGVHALSRGNVLGYAAAMALRELKGDAE